MEIVRTNYTVEIEPPEIYVDNQKRGRSGHMSHAMTEYAPGCFIDFNSNCSAKRLGGHAAFGWIEYRFSKDSGKTYSDIFELPISKEILYDGIHTISVENAITCDDGTIVITCLKNTQKNEICCEPYDVPFVITSTDFGKTWSEPKEYTSYKGRPYDMLYRNGTIYIMHCCNEEFLGSTSEHKYRIYISIDSGRSFEELSVIPFDTLKRGYGSILFDAENNLHAYIYNYEAENYMDHAISKDNGKTWTLLEPCYMAKSIRNPQTAYIDGVYILHGRMSKAGGFVIYTSEDATNWDEGTIIVDKNDVLAFYSNNITLNDENGKFLLIQYSDTYEEWGKVNVMHLKLRIKPKN